MSTDVKYYLEGNEAAKPLTRKLQTTKSIYNYKQKTEQQIKEVVQFAIDIVLANNPAYKFVNSKSYFNKTGGIEMQLNFELK